MKIFTYGTLTTSGGNNILMQKAGGELIGEVHTEVPYTLELGQYPELYNTPGTGEIIHGELYEVPEESVDLLDYYEGHPSLYERGPIKVVKGSDVLDCEVYFYKEILKDTTTNPCACEYCGSEDADLIPHPYILEMYNEESLTWLCSECAYQAGRDV